MKALKYLQKVGAVPEYESWDLLMSLVVICNELFSSEIMLEPDCVEWTQLSEDDEDLQARCEAVLFGTSGDVRAFFPHICKQDTEFLKGLIEALLETRLAMYCIAAGEDFDFDDEGWFTEQYNDRVGLKGKKRFPTKSAILHTYYNGSLTEGGQDILSELAGTKTDFRKKVEKLQSDFALHLSEQDCAIIETAELKSEFPNPFEGGYEVRLSLRLPGAEATEECTLHWAPWPTAKTNSTHLEMRNICNLFNGAQRSRWFAENNNDLVVSD